jgi:hypothetical protein
VNNNTNTAKSMGLFKKKNSAEPATRNFFKGSKGTRTSTTRLADAQEEEEEDRSTGVVGKKPGKIPRRFKLPTCKLPNFRRRRFRRVEDDDDDAEDDRIAVAWFRGVVDNLQNSTGSTDTGQSDDAKRERMIHGK